MAIDTTSYRSPNYDRNRIITPQAILIHSDEGTRQSSLAWLTNPASQVSSQYYVARNGDVFQLVDDTRRAWHAGVSSYAGISDWNSASIGIECEHRQGQDWPQAQKDALADLCRTKIAQYGIPQERIAAHRWVAVPQGRKRDPTDWSDTDLRAWIAALYAPTPAPSAATPTEDSTILAPARCTQQQATAYILARPHPNYTSADISLVIVPAYFRICQSGGVDPCLAIAQMIHETGNLSSSWSSRPHRNPAGIGVTGERGKGVSFASWADDAIPAQVGRLLAYALPAPQGTEAQQALITKALSYRPLDPRARGTAPTLKPLGAAHNPANAGKPQSQWIAGWAWPGDQYGAAIARIMAAIRSVV